MYLSIWVKPIPEMAGWLSGALRGVSLNAGSGQSVISFQVS
jgi:hypothetical protein